MDEIEQLIERCHRQYKQWYGALSVRKATKITGGKDTGIPCITFYVPKKLKMIDCHYLTSTFSGFELIPERILNMLTDVVELSSDYTIGKTSMSSLSPDQQRRMSSGVSRR